MPVATAIRHIMEDVLAFPDHGSEKTPTLPRALAHPCFLYVHVPFCTSLCPYCSFHRVQFKPEKAEAYFRALRQEISWYHDNGYRFDEVYIGGGTPTLCTDELVDTLDLIRQRSNIRKISVETNPNHLRPQILQRLRDAGVNRLSIGVQSFDNDLLKMMDRHDAYGSGEEIIARLHDTVGIFDTLNIDMMFNLPGQTLWSLERDLNILGDLNADQISWYPLMIASSTEKRMQRLFGDADFSNEKRFYQLIRHRLRDSHPPSTAWTFSRTNEMIDEYIINHEEYVGVGSGAFSYLRGSLYATSFSVNRYRELVARNGTAITRQRTYSLRWQRRYSLLMQLFGLRCTPGPDNPVTALKPELALLLLTGVVRKTSDGYELTDRGMYLWVVIMREFFTAVNRFRDQMRAHIREEYEPGVEKLLVQQVAEKCRHP